MKGFDNVIIIKDNNMLYEMANISPNTTGESFTFWVDDVGKNRGGKHNLPRFKPEKSGVQLDIVIEPDGTVRFDKQSTNKLHKFGPYKDALKFVEKFKEPLLMHWNKEIDTVQLGTIIRLVNKKKYTVEDAIQAIINDDF